MILVHVTRQVHDTEMNCLYVEDRTTLIFLLSMLEKDERVLSFTVSESNSFGAKRITDLKSRFNMPNAFFVKWKP